MNWLKIFKLRFRALFQKQKLDAQMNEEMRSHIEMQTQENIDAGMNAEEARYEALRQFGWVERIKETCRDQRGMGWIENFAQDVRYGARTLRKNPGFTAVAVLTLALGIGANTAIFNLLDAVLLRSLPVHQPDRLFFITSGDNPHISYPLIDRFQRANLSVGETFAYRTLKVRLNAGSGNNVALGQLVSGNYFSTLSVTMLQGRAITSSDDQTGAAPVAVISHRCWKRRFGSDPDVFGKALNLNGVAFTIIGVTPREFYGLDAQAVPEAYVPVRQHALLTPSEPRLLDEYGSWVFSAVVRVNPNVTEETARSRLGSLYQQVISENAKEWIRAKDLSDVLRRGVDLSPAGQGIASLREKFSRPLLVLMGASGLVFLIACANVANLLMARGTIRRREMALRMAIGASRWRVTRLLTAECLLLAGLGSGLGLLLAVWSSHGLLRFLPEEAVGVAASVGLNERLLLYAILASFVATALGGLIPAVRGSDVALNAALGEGGRNFVNSGTISRLGRFLVVSQVAFSLVLLVGAGLFVRSLRELVTLDPGFQREKVLLLTVQPELAGYSEADQERLAGKLAAPDLLERLEAIPGVRSASLSSSREFGDRPSWRMAVQLIGNATQKQDSTGASMRWVTPKHFETFTTPVLRGRSVMPTDSFKAPRVAIINETMARQYFTSADPLGRRFKLSSGLETLGEIEIVGVVRDTKSTSLRARPTAMFYLPFAQFPNTENLVFALRCANSPQSVAVAARREIESLDSNLVVTRVTTLSDVVDASLVQERAMAFLSTSFGVLSLLLAAIGLYGVLAYAVNQRRREIGVRLALGAQRRDVLRLIASQGMKLVGLGLIAGIAGAVAISRFLTSLLYGINSMDALTFLVCPIVLIFTALLACYIPARRAGKVDPMEALRHE